MPRHWRIRPIRGILGRLSERGVTFATMEFKEANLQSGEGQVPTLEDKQRRRMLIALALLLVALLVVLIKDRRFWFSSNTPQESAPEEASIPEPPAATPAAGSAGISTSAPAQQPARKPAILAKSKKSSGKAPAPPPAEKVEQSQPAAGPVITATNRTVLPPLEVEVVAGGSHHPLSPNNNSVKVDMDSNSSSVPSPAPAVPVPDEGPSQPADTSARVTLPPATAERVSRSVKPSYPMLAKQMKVQGAVVLQALIDKAGNIQELHVVTGPAILATAAEEAVKQWHFKPYYQRGQAVETEARITVNFTISTY
ncbi:MAG TPA: energy transducer TonB [Terriglobales bacterium]|nr:energy transducer TonB [Terriglobales bacterium]